MAQNLAMVQAEMETITNMFNRCVRFPHSRSGLHPAMANEGFLRCKSVCSRAIGCTTEGCTGGCTDSPAIPTPTA